MSNNRLDLTGQRFGKLVVLRFQRMQDTNYGRYTIWWCRCDCGTEKEVVGKGLREGAYISCGCRQRKNKYTDLREKFGELWPTRVSFYSMHYRCGPVHGDPCYTKKGIVVCKRWSGEDGFRNFIKDLGPRPEGTTLDRIDPDWHYEPKNCRWATAEVQTANRSCEREEIDVEFDETGVAM